MSTASSTRQPSSKPTPGSLGSPSTTRGAYHANTRLLTSVARPTASSTSKVSTPLLPPTRMIPPAHIRHAKSSSLSSISDEIPMRLSLSETPQYLNLEKKFAIPKAPEQWSNLNYPPDDQARSQAAASRKLSKTSSNFVSRIPVRVGTNSSTNLSKVGSSDANRTSVLQPKTNLASVSSPSLNQTGTKLSRSTTKPTSGLNGSSQSASKSAAPPRSTNLRQPSAIRTSLAPNRTASSSLPPTKPQNGTSRLISTSSTNLKGGIYEDPSDGSFSKKHPTASYSSSSLAQSIKPANALTKASVTKRGNSGAPRPGESTSAVALTKSTSLHGAGRPKVTGTSIQPPPKASAVNGVVSLPIGSSKPSLPHKSHSEFSNKGTSFSSTTKGVAKLTSASAISKGVSSSNLKSASKLSINEAMAKSYSSSRVSRPGESSSRASLKASSEAKLKPTSKLSAINVSRTTSLEGHTGACLSKKASLSAIYTPRAVPKELSRIPSPPSHYQSKRVTSISSSQTPTRKAKSFVSTTPFTERAPSTTSLTSNYCSEPLRPQEVLKTFGAKLTPFEHKEILEYPHIYYFGANVKKTSSRESALHHFSTPEGDLIFNPSDHLAYRYEIQKSLGKGSFGQVLRAYDYKVGREVAIKVIRNSERFHRQALTEIQLLEALKRWDHDGSHNVLHILDSFIFRSHLCIVTELYGINLYEYIKQNQFLGFRMPAVRNFAVQILKCLTLLNTHSVIHCDLKPENILLAGPNNSQIKVIDFGSSCFSSQRIYTYIQSRFYRSPEVILELPYGPPIDMWSFGCILAELSNGHPIFPGESESEQMACILEVLGQPDLALIAKSKRRYSFFDVSGNPRITLSPRKRRVIGSKPLSQILKDADDLYVDFVARCLEFDPDKRMTPAQALAHPWITGALSSQPSSLASASPSYSRRLTAASADMRSTCGSDAEMNDFCSIPSSHS